MKTDALKRRLRYEKPQPLEKSIALGPRDYAVFQAIHRHGPLPTHYLFEFTRHLNGNFTAFQHRLTKLYNGTQTAAPLLVRPPQQFASFKARYQPLVYDLSPLAVQLLSERGKLERTPDRIDHFLHRFMGACVGASIELACREQGLTYISYEEILAHGKIEKANPLAVGLTDGKCLIPDGLFGIKYRDGSYRFFAIEIDRNTESIERKRLDQSGFGRKLHGYIDIITNRGYKAQWGVPSLMVLTVTTNHTHLQNMLDYLGGIPTSKAEHFLFRARPEFGANWEVPPLMNDLITEPWAGVRLLTIQKP
jgi:hypothetical protein